MDATAAKALVKAQTEMGAVLKNAQNPHLKNRYADLGAVMEAALPALHANGFALMQPSGTDEHGPYVDTVFLHESGADFRSRVHLLVGKGDMQGLGSAQTYARRYGLLGMAGLAPEDDDGNAAVKGRQAAQEPRREPAPPRGEPGALAKQAAAQEPQRDPRAIADAIIGKVRAADSMDALNRLLAAPKVDEAWEWLAVNAPDESARLKAAVDAKRDDLDPIGASLDGARDMAEAPF